MKKLNFTFLLLFTISIFSQSVVTKNNQTPFIEVIGKSEREVVPNEIYIDISLKERVEGGKKVSLEFLENRLKRVLKEIGIPLENLSFSDVNAVISKTGWFREDILSHANYTLKVNGAEKLKKTFDQFKKLKISEARITKATHSNIQSLRKENRIAAIKAAKEKADYLLSAIGEKTGKPIEINEINAHNGQEYAYANFSKSNSLYKSREKVLNFQVGRVVQFEKIKITASVYAKFKIK